MDAISKIKSFITKIKDKNTECKRPKFKQGQYIYNKKYDTFAIVEAVYVNPKYIEYSSYSLKYLKNPKAVALGVGLDHPRSKKIKAIDAYYELADERVVSILFRGKDGRAKV